MTVVQVQGKKESTRLTCHAWHAPSTLHRSKNNTPIPAKLARQSDTPHGSRRDPPWKLPPRVPRRRRASPSTAAPSALPAPEPAAPAAGRREAGSRTILPGYTSLPEVSGWRAQGRRTNAPARRATPGRPRRGPHSPRGAPGAVPPAPVAPAPPNFPSCAAATGSAPPPAPAAAEPPGTRGRGAVAAGGLNRRRARALARGGDRRPRARAAVAGGGRAWLRPPAPPRRPAAVRPSAGSKRGAPAECCPPSDGDTPGDLGSPAGESGRRPHGAPKKLYLQMTGDWSSSTLATGKLRFHVKAI
ncbi:uncharacterized protein V5649_009740 [Rhynchonycteris naso]